MFKKRRRKTFSPGTFIPTPARIMAILQLCIAFSLLLWILSQPFMGDLFTIKSYKLLYESVMGKGSIFTTLPQAMQEKITVGYTALKAEMQSSFWLKLHRSIDLLVLKTPPLELAWIFFSILIPILLLKRKEGAVPAVWLLLLITVAYAVDNRLHASSKLDTPAKLYPTEELLLQRYLKEPLKTSILEQAEQLKKGWQMFLVDQWAKEPLSENPQRRTSQIEKGQFSFDVARLNSLGNISLVLSVNAPPQQHSLLTLGLYLFWNSLLAVIVTKYCRGGLVKFGVQ